jgi:hypothetical protein
MLSSILRGLATGYLRVDGGLERLRYAALGVAGGFFSAALSPEEQSAVSVRVYERTFRKSPRRTLTDWEKDWFARRLPAPRRNWRARPGAPPGESSGALAVSDPRRWSRPRASTSDSGSDSPAPCPGRRSTRWAGRTGGT